MSSQKATKTTIKTSTKVTKLVPEAPSRSLPGKAKGPNKKPPAQRVRPVGMKAPTHPKSAAPTLALVKEAPDPLPRALTKNRPTPLSDEATAKAFREDASLDRRIIEGMLADREVFLAQMEGEGFTTAVILRRAAELGLSEALIRQVKGVAADLAGERPGRRPAPASLAPRTCLACDRTFLSSGKGNRLCMRCRGGDAGLAQL